jgi:predicted TPR repeat methyltransferase
MLHLMGHHVNSLEDFILGGLKWALASLGAISAYIVTQWRNDQGRLEVRVAAIERTYVERQALDAHVQQLRDEMRTGFDRVLDKLDGKADKPG